MISANAQCIEKVIQLVVHYHEVLIDEILSVDTYNRPYGEGTGEFNARGTANVQWPGALALCLHHLWFGSTHGLWVTYLMCSCCICMVLLYLTKLYNRCFVVFDHRTANDSEVTCDITSWHT